MPKIPSTTIPAAGHAWSAPACKQHVVGIRPGEKLHETMIPADDAHCTVELEDRYVILQSFANAAREAYLHRGAKPVAEGFSYSSDTNPEKLDARGLQTLLARWPMPDRAKLRSGAWPFLPYGRQEIGDADIKAVVEALCSDWLTTGPRVCEFEKAFAAHCGAGEGVAVNSGTAALHGAMRAIGVHTGDEVIVPAITFAASANAAIYEGGAPVFADVEPDTLLIDPASVRATNHARTKAIVAVDYAGQPADYDALRELAAGRGIRLIADACHAPGATYKGRKTGTLADISCFSFHPVKHLTTCEGGMALTDDAEMAAHMRRFRNHGIDSDHRSREANGAHAYDMVELGYNYRLPDVQCALGMAQLARLDGWVRGAPEDRRAV